MPVDKVLVSGRSRLGSHRGHVVWAGIALCLSNSEVVRNRELRELFTSTLKNSSASASRGRPHGSPIYTHRTRSAMQWR